MFELQDEFLLGFLSPYLSEIHCPIFEMDLLHRKCLNAPKFGNNDPYADDIGRDLENFFRSIFHSYTNISGGKLDVRYVPVTSHILLGRIVSALPNGRKAGEPLSEGISPSQGFDAKGPTASLLSVANTKASSFQEGGEGVLNMKLSPQAVAGEEGTKVLAALIRTWCDLKIWHIQFNIQKFSLHDGPGIRDLVFMKGCPLRCQWCSNPESQRPQPEIAYNADQCIGFESCGLCQDVCLEKAISRGDSGRAKIDRSLCNNCGDCATVCPDRALEMIGREMSISEILDFVATPGILQDVPPHTADCYTALEMIAHTTKPLVILVSRTEALPDVLDLLEHLHGNLSLKPFVIPLMTPITPLLIDAGTFDRMFVSIRRGLPFVYVNYGMAGANTPITPYGSLTLLMAEIIAGITLSQLVQEGAKVIAGCLNAFLDLRTMLNFYDPMSYLLNLACGEMMAFYQIPHYGNSGNAVGWGGDIIAAGHQWMNHVLACMGNAGMAAFVGTVLGSKTFSPKLAVYADEVIAQARRISKGFEVDDYSILMREIVAAGPAGNFLSSDLTLKHFRQAYFQSAIFPSFTMEDWSSDGCPKAENYLSRYTNDMIEDLSISDESFAMIEKGEAFITRNLKSRLKA